MIQTYFGNGKGKTSAATGAAIRCCGCGKKVLFVQFFKNNDSSECNVFKDIRNIDILVSSEKYVLFDNLNTARTEALTKAYNKLLFKDVKECAERYHMIVLDEILDAITFGYIKEEHLLSMLRTICTDVEIILTGHLLTENIAQISDYISEIREVKHPFTKGTPPREGIEF